MEELKQSERSDDGRLKHILQLHRNLMISPYQVDLLGGKVLNVRDSVSIRNRGVIQASVISQGVQPLKTLGTMWSGDAHGLSERRTISSGGTPP